MPSQQYQYYLVFDNNFYRSHYIEVEKILKPYNIRYNAPYFCFSDSHDPIVIQSFFDRIFNDTGSILTLPHQLTWIIKLYNFLHQFNQAKNKIELQIASNHPAKIIFTWRNDSHNHQ